MGPFREFFLILAGGFIGAVLGTGFGGLVGLLFPNLVVLLWWPMPVGSPSSLGAGMGMVSGLPIGAVAMVIGRVVGAIRVWASLRTRASGHDDPGPTRGDLAFCEPTHFAAGRTPDPGPTATEGIRTEGRP